MNQNRRALDVSPELVARVRDVEAALADYRPDVDAVSVIEIPKLALADAVLAAMRRKARPAKAALNQARTRRRA